MGMTDCGLFGFDDKVVEPEPRREALLIEGGLDLL